MRNLCCALMLASTLLAAQEAPRPVSLAWRRFGADLSGPARPSGYLSVVGRRAALIGTETGTFEAWAWPLKLLHAFELEFKTPLYDAPVLGRDIARRVEVTPAGATIVYVHPAFTVTERLFAPLNEPAVVAGLGVGPGPPPGIPTRVPPRLPEPRPARPGGPDAFLGGREKGPVCSARPGPGEGCFVFS